MTYQFINRLLVLFTILFLFVANAYAQEKEKDLSVDFEEADFIGFGKNLRKWDAPIFADLDKDGWVDMIVNNHGLGISVCWNNHGHFMKPYDIIMGDIHGVTVGDFDSDGELELVLSRGGGSGGNARNSKIIRFHKDRTFNSLEDFNIPLALMRGRTVKFFDGNNDGFLDLINFGFPDNSKKGESENYIYKNNQKGQLTLATKLPRSFKDGQKTLLTDYNKDGITDFLIYGHGKVRLFKGNQEFIYQEVLDFPEIKDVTGIVEIDFDNDGDFDLYFTRGNEFGKNDTFYDAISNTFGFHVKRGVFQFDDLLLGDVINLINYQSQWPINDAIFIGESGYHYPLEGETHSGKDIQLINSNALGFPDYPNKKGLYIGYIGNDSWKLQGNSWSPATGVIKGVKRYNVPKMKQGLADVLIENQNGKFIDVTSESGLFKKTHHAGVATADLNNDGYLDIIITPRGNLIHELSVCIYLNNGNKTFTELTAHTLISKELGAIGMGIETVDYNLDGKIDIVVGNERGKWHLFQNKIIINNKFLNIYVGKSPNKGVSPLGAEILLKSCNGLQVQHLGASGAMYSQSYDQYVHFGLGSCTKAEVIVRWSNGEENTLKVKDFNKIIKIGVFDQSVE